MDNAFRLEGNNLVATFGVTPQGWFIVDGAQPNAYANPGVTSPFGPDGTVLIGLTLIQGELYRDGGAGLSLPAILAHEMTHILQFRFGRHPLTPVNELQADFMAGWYLARRGYNYFTVAPAFQAFFSRGTYAFNDPNFHGTPQQRLFAVQSGFGSGFLPLGSAYGQGLLVARQMLGV